MQFRDESKTASPAYGLRNRKTGRVVRLETVGGGIYGPKAALTYDPRFPFWTTGDLQGLIMTYVEDRERYNAHPETPCWNGVDPRECDFVRFFEEAEYGPDGGDPVSVSRYMMTFDLLPIYDLREERCLTKSMKTIHYGVMQGLFPEYDMDRHEQMDLAVVPYDPSKGSAPSLRGDVAITEAVGPARVAGWIHLPDGWELNEVQKAERGQGLQHILLLLDVSKLATWLDYDSIDRGPAPTDELENAAPAVTS